MINFKNPFKKDTPIANTKDTKRDKREAVRLTSKQRDILTALFSLPVRPEWLTEDEVDKINRDSTVISSIGSRKAATLKKEILITCDNKDIKDNLEAVFDYETLDSILDTPYQGFSVFEVNWFEKNDLNFYPKLVERDYKDFELHQDVLKFVNNGFALDIAPYKAIYATYKAKYNKPYGQPIYVPLFWLIEFKNASLQFWIELLERFGTPWVIAKTEGNKDDLADEIYNMLGGDGAVLDAEDSLEIKTIQDKANFKEIIEYIDDQIRQVILGGNLTSNVKGGSQAAATVHNDIREDLAAADENIVNKIIREIIRMFKELNNIDIEIKGKLKDIDEPNKDLADRDKVIYDMGFDIDEEYIQTTYNIKVKKRDIQSQAIIPNSKLAFSKSMPQDELSYQSGLIDLNKPFTFQEQILKIVEGCTSYEEVQDKLLESYPDLKTKDLEDLLYKNIANADIRGRAEIEDENPNG
jgi:phage gp29-like protein